MPWLLPVARCHTTVAHVVREKEQDVWRRRGGGGGQPEGNPKAAIAAGILILCGLGLVYRYVLQAQG